MYRGITNLTVADSSFSFQWYIAYSIRGSHSFSFPTLLSIKKNILHTLCVVHFLLFRVWRWWRRRCCCNSWTSKASSAISTYVLYVRLEILFITQQREKHEGILVFFPSSVNFFFRHFPPLLSHGWKVKKNPENLFFLICPFLFPYEKTRFPYFTSDGRKSKNNIRNGWLPHVLTSSLSLAAFIFSFGK